MSEFKLNIRPLNKYIIASAFKQEKKVEKILMISEEGAKYFIAEAVCENKQDIKVGDKLMIEQYGSVEMKIDDQVFYVINIDRVIAILE